MATETYALADFTGLTGSNSVNGPALHKEIADDTAITIQVAGVTIGSDVQIEFLATLSGAEKTELDSLVAAHTGDPLSGVGTTKTALGNRYVALEGDAAQRTDGILRVQLEPSTKQSKIRVQGFQFTADLKADAGDDPMESHADVKFDAADEGVIDFQGLVGIWTANHKTLDYMELYAMFPKTGTEAQWIALGLGTWPFTPYDTPEAAGAGDVELAKFGRNVYLPPSGEVPPIIGEGTFTVADPIFLRFAYFANGVEGVDTAPDISGMVRYWYDLG